MGLFNRLFGTNKVSSDRAYFFSREEKKLPICQEAAQRLAPVCGGTVAVRDGGGEVHITGEFSQHPVRIIIRVPFASLRIETRLAGQLGLSGLRLRYDSQAAQSASEQLDRNEWDDDNPSRTFFLSPHVCMEEEPEQLRQMKTNLDQLPQDLVSGLLSLMESAAKAGTFFSLQGKEAQLDLADSSYVLDKGSTPRLESVLQLLASIAAAAEKTWG